MVMTTLISRILISLVAISLLMESLLCWSMEKPTAELEKSNTFENIDHVVEADASIPLIGFFEQILDILVLAFAQDCPLFVD